MLRLAITRVLLGVPVLLAVSLISFIMLQLAPGDPALVEAGLDPDPGTYELLREQMGLDDPLPVRYFDYLGNILHGDLGDSYTSGDPVSSLIVRRVSVTAQIAGLALLLIVIVGVPLGISAARSQGGKVDELVRLISLTGVSVPNFVIGIFLVLLFGWWWTGVLPYQGFVRPSVSVGGSLQTSILPAFALAAPQIGLVARLVRSSLMEVLGEDYITAGRSFGVSERALVWKDALRNALFPVVTILGAICGFLLGGSVVVEEVFGVPGVGRLLVNSFTSRDYPVTMGVVLFMGAVFVTINVVIDIFYGVINPRVRLESGD